MVERPKATYFITCNYRKENIQYICQNFDTTILQTPTGTEDLDGIVFWPRLIDHANWNREGSIMVTSTTGEDHLPKCDKVISLQGETDFLSSITPTAEHTMGLIHAVHRRIYAAQDHVMNGGWDRYAFAAPKMLSRSVLGVIGYGRLGKLMCRYADKMFHRVLTYDANLQEDLSPYEASLPYVLQNADVLTIHAGASSGLYLSFTELLSLPHNAIIINTARGDIIDFEAVVRLIEEGHLWGAGFDTLAVEPFEIDLHSSNGERIYELIKQGRLVITPHIGGSTKDAYFETERFVIDKAIEEYKK